MAAVWILILGSLFSSCYVQGVLENVALNKTTTAALSLSLWSASNAVDGDNNVIGGSNTCYHSDSYPAFWSVDLGQEYQLYAITVYFRNSYEYRTANSSIYLDNTPSRVCYTFPSSISNNPTTLTCNETARHVTIRNPGRGPGDDDTLNICEVEIYACSNGSYGSDCSETCNNCPHCDRWSGICSGDCYPGWTGERCDTQCGSSKYGINCLHRCTDRHCNGNSSCNQMDGSCDKGCQAGWVRHDCTEGCDSIHYGDKCLSVCGSRNCKGMSSCDHFTGLCDHGCEAGWNGRDCITACDREHYGPDCTGCVPPDDVREGPPAVPPQDCVTEVVRRDDLKLTSTSPDVNQVNQVNQVNLVNQTGVVGGTLASVIVIILVAVIGIVLWKRRKRRRENEEASHHVYSSTKTVKERESEVRTSHAVDSYDTMDATSRDNTYTAIEPIDQGETIGVSQQTDVRVSDECEPVTGGTYENLPTTSLSQDGDITGLEKRNAYENVTRI